MGGRLDSVVESMLSLLKLISMWKKRFFFLKIHTQPWFMHALLKNYSLCVYINRTNDKAVGAKC